MVVDVVSNAKGQVIKMLTLNNVSTGYGGEDVIKNITLQIENSVSIIGPNGCGKTTLLKAIANILPAKGSIMLQNKPFSGMKRREISMQIAMLSQQPAVYFSYSVYDTVMMGRYLHIKNRFLGTPTEKDREVVIKSLDAVNMLADKDREITKLSGGQLQRVFLAQVLAQEPLIILLDEPTNHLDLKCRVEIIEYLKNWAEENERIVIGVLHDINLALELSEQLLVMKDGEIRANGTVDEIVADGLLDDVYEMDVAEYMKKTFKRWNRSLIS
jgi:iron complex transport system ATP-binding protein